MNKYISYQIFPLVLLLATGCSSSSAPNSKAARKASPSPTVISTPAPEVRTIERTNSPGDQISIATCRKALDSLQKVNAQRAVALKSNFSSLVNAAAQYNAVRGQVGNATRQAVDSMYQFKTIKLCADIDKELMDSLVNRGERAVR